MLLSNATNDLLWKIHLVLLQNKRVVIIWAVVGKLQLIESELKFGNDDSGRRRRWGFWSGWNSNKWRLTVRQIFRSLSRICFPPSDKLSLELATQIKLSWASHAYLLCLMIWQWLAAVKPTKIMAWPFEERPQRNWISVLEEFLKSLSLQDSFQRVFGDIKKVGGVARGSGFIKCNRRMHLSPTTVFFQSFFRQASRLEL